jgi:ribonuclease-3
MTLKMTEFMMAQLGYTFKDPCLLQSALTHRSYFVENRGKAPGHFERLEFLGDAVLDLILSEALMEAHPQAEEGTLSKWRASLVNETTLAAIARQMQLGRYVYVGKSEEAMRPALRPRLLASAFEAVVAALYLDAGLPVVRAFILRHFATLIGDLNIQNEFAADFKTRLQEWAQKHFRVVPEYKLVGADGPDHARTFTIEVTVKNEWLGQGSGKSRKEAEQSAANVALRTINVKKENRE